MTVPKMMNTANCHITADGGDTGRLPQKSEKNFLIGLRETHPALPVLLQHRRRAFSQSLSLCEKPAVCGRASASADDAWTTDHAISDRI